MREHPGTASIEERMQQRRSSVVRLKPG
jgi:hypothetical protein